MKNMHMPFRVFVLRKFSTDFDEIWYYLVHIIKTDLKMRHLRFFTAAQSKT